MSTFKVGDRVRNRAGWTAVVIGVGAGPPTLSSGDGTITIRSEKTPATGVYHADYFDLIAPLPGSSGVTQSEWSEAIAKINAQHKALDTVRRFLAGHSFASCSLACNRELREVMAVVLAALDADKAAK